jgi:large subunit ribosomal protein L29
MSFYKFTEINSFSSDEIFEGIEASEKQLFNIRFKKATRQTFKSHEIKNLKRRIAQLKTLLTKIQKN